MRPPQWSCRFSPTPGRLVHHRDAVLLQQRARPDAGQLQQLRRVDRAAGQQHLAPRTHLTDRAVLAELDADRAFAFGQHAMRQRADLHLQVRPVEHRLQIAHRGRTAPPVAHRQLQRPDTFLFGAIEVAVVGIARLLRALDERVVQRMIGAQVGHRERPALAVEFVRAVLLILRLAEIRQHVVIRPAGVAELAPQVEVLLLAADIDQAVDRRRTAKHLAARQRNAAVVEFRHRLGFEIPRHLRIVDVAIEPRGDVDPGIAVLAAGLQQQHAWSCHPRSGGWPARSRPSRRRQR